MKWNDELEKVNGTLVKTSDVTDGATDAFGAFSAAILNGIGAIDLWRDAMDSVNSVLEGLTIAMGGVTETQRDYLRFQKELVELDKEAAKEKIKALNSVWKTSDTIAARVKVFTDQAKIDTDNYNDALDAKITKEEADAKATERARLVLEKKSKALQDAMALSKATWNATKDGEAVSNMADFAVNDVVTKENTKAIKDNTDILKTNWSWQVKGATQIDAMKRAILYNKAGGSNYSNELMNNNRLKQLQDRSKSNSTNSSFSGRMYDPYEDQMKELTDALEMWTLKLETSIKELAAANEALSDALDFHQKLISALRSVANDMKSISNALSANYEDRAREVLYGGTSKGLTYEQAKANAAAAWELYQTDTLNQEYVDNYNKRMDELIGTLEYMNDSSNFRSRKEQEWAKAKALYETGQQQEAQDVAKDSVDKQLNALNKILAVNITTDANTLKANTIADGIKDGTWSVKSATDAVNASNKDIATKTNAVKSATDSVKYATDQVTSISKKIEKKKTENDTGTAITGISSKKVNIGDTWQIDKATTSGLTYAMKPTYQMETYATMGTVNRRGYRSGGYTGDMGVNSVAGMVHGQEYVLNAQTTRNLGLNNDSGGTFNEIASLMYEQLKTTKKMHSIEKQMLQLQREVA